MEIAVGQRPLSGKISNVRDAVMQIVQEDRRIYYDGVKPEGDTARIRKTPRV